MSVIDVVIPTFDPDMRFLDILRMLGEQVLPVHRIHVINTGRAGMDALLQKCGMDEAQLLAQYPQMDLHHITPEEFDHGGTRNRGAAMCSGADYVLMMTQDALPADAHLTERLASVFTTDGKIEAAYARQLPNKDASAVERYTREFNYPETSSVKSQADFDRLGIKTYFCSNVCCMYRLDVFHSLGGFPENMIFNEDMVYAGRALQSGWKIAYCADALVYHSHHYGAGQQFHRNFDLGVSQADHPEIFAAARSEGEGVNYVRTVLHYLGENHARGEAPGFIVSCACRLAGYRLGKHYRKLPMRMVRSCSQNRHFWDRRQQEG